MKRHVAPPLIPAKDPNRRCLIAADLDSSQLTRCHAAFYCRVERELSAVQGLT